MKRKLALMNCSQGPWVRTGDFREPMVHVNLPSGTVIGVFGVAAPDPHNAAGWMLRISESGVHRLDPVLWMCVEVLEGEARGVSCIFMEAA